MKRILCWLLVIMLFLGLSLVGCQKGSDTGSVDKPKESTSPASDKQAENEKEDEEDDKATSVTIEIMTHPWVGTPLGDNDPYKKWLDEYFGANFKLTQSPEFSTEILTRFAADDPPDIFDLGKNDLYKMYDQNVLVEDWNPYLDKMPTAAKNIGEIAKSYYTRDGKLICLPNLPGEQKWAFEIRGDWLKTLGLEMPKTVDDLLDVARAFTRNDPDGDGQDNTYAFTSAGGGQSLGEIGQLLAMYGPRDFYIAKDGTVQHPILDGNHQAFLQFMKTVVDEKLIDPDWYTQGWNERKPNLYKGMFGIVWYPPMALLTETDVSRNNDGVVLNWYEVMPVPSGSPIGGKLPSLNPIGILRSASAKAEQDTVKWEKILRFFEETAYPNDGYFKLRWGVEIDGFEMIPLEGGYYYIDLLGPEGKHARGERENQSLSLYDWGKIICTYSDKIITGSTPEPGELVYKTVRMEQDIEKIGRHPQDSFLLDLDPDTVEEVNRIRNEFEINFILGKTNDYEAFKKAWLNSGGQMLLDEATKQFKAKGLIK